MINKLHKEQLVKFLVLDATLTEPHLVDTIFSGKELCAAAKLDIPKEQIDDLMRYLVAAHYTTYTEKTSPDGPYFNIAPHLFTAVHSGVRNKRFVNKQIAPEKGWCIISTPNNTYRLACEGRGCKFFFESEKECLQKKFFF